MAESDVQVSEGSGKRLRTLTRSIGGNTVHEEVVVIGQPHVASYAVVGGASIATLNDHLIQIMAGALLNVRIHRIRVWQSVLAGAVNRASFSILRVTTAGTGGTLRTAAPYDSSDAVAGAVIRNVTTSPGTEGATEVGNLSLGVVSANPMNVNNQASWEAINGIKPIIIPAGTSNGLVLKNGVAVASAAIGMEIVFSETTY